MVGIKATASRIAAVAGLIIGALALVHPAKAQNIDTTTSWDGTTSISSWGVTNTATYGQTITATSSPSLLTGFTFYLKHTSGITPQYQAFVYAWDAVNSRITGSALFSSGILTAPSPNAMTAVFINTGSVSLAPGQQYVLFFTTSTVTGQSNGQYSYGALPTNTVYTGGQFVFNNNGANFASLASSNWSLFNEDLAFIAWLQPAGAGANVIGAQQSSFQLMNSFLDLLLDPFTTNRNGAFGPGGLPLGYAQETPKWPAEVKNAYAMATKAPRRQVSYRPWNVWASTYGNYGKTSGDIAGVSQTTSARAWGFAAGLDYRLANDTTVGFALAGAHTSWDVTGALGDGKGDAFQAGVYANRWFNRFFLSAAAALTYHHMSTDRLIGADDLSSSFNAYNFGGRLEGGYLIPMAAVDVTPYAALQAQTFQTPTHSETSSLGSALPLTYASHNASVVRGELGARFEKGYVTSSGMFKTFGRLAWAHDWTDDPTLNTSLALAPVATFVINGTPPAHDLALMQVGAELRMPSNWALSARLGGEFGNNSTRIYNGNLKVAYTW